MKNKTHWKLTAKKVFFNHINLKKVEKGVNVLPRVNFIPLPSPDPIIPIDCGLVTCNFNSLTSSTNSKGDGFSTVRPSIRPSVRGALVSRQVCSVFICYKAGKEIWLVID